MCETSLTQGTQVKIRLLIQTRSDEIFILKITSNIGHILAQRSANSSFQLSQPKQGSHIHSLPKKKVKDFHQLIYVFTFRFCSFSNLVTTCLFSLSPWSNVVIQVAMVGEGIQDTFHLDSLWHQHDFVQQSIVRSNGNIQACGTVMEKL